MKEGRYRDDLKNCYFFFKIIYSLKTLLSNSGPKSTKTQKKLFQDKTQMKKNVKRKGRFAFVIKKPTFLKHLAFVSFVDIFAIC